MRHFTSSNLSSSARDISRALESRERLFTGSTFRVTPASLSKSSICVRVLFIPERSLLQLKTQFIQLGHFKSGRGIDHRISCRVVFGKSNKITDPIRFSEKGTKPVQSECD